VNAGAKPPECTSASQCLSIAVVRVGGAVHYRHTITLPRAKALGNPLNPLLLLYFVGGSRFLVNN